MALIYLPALINMLMAALAIFGVYKGQHTGIGHVAGLAALFVLPLANLSFLWWLLSGIPFFPLMTPAGISVAVTGGLAVIGAVVAFSAAIRGKQRGRQK